MQKEVKRELVNIRQVFKFLQAKNVMSGYRFIFLHHDTVETDVVTLNLFCGLGLGLWIGLGLGYQCLFKAKKRKPDGS